MNIIRRVWLVALYLIAAVLFIIGLGGVLAALHVMECGI